MVLTIGDPVVSSPSSKVVENTSSNERWEEKERSECQPLVVLCTLLKDFHVFFIDILEYVKEIFNSSNILLCRISFDRKPISNERIEK